jgi:hypothetical protein
VVIYDEGIVKLTAKLIGVLCPIQLKRHESSLGHVLKACSREVVLFFHLLAVNGLAEKFLILDHHQLFVLFRLIHLFLGFLFCLFELLSFKWYGVMFWRMREHDSIRWFTIDAQKLVSRII